MTIESASMPEGWAAVTIRDTGEYINGLAFKPTDWGELGTPIIRIQNLTDEAKPFNRTRRQVGSEFLVDDGDILVSWSATLDAFIWRGERAVLNQHIFKVVPNQSIVDDRFLYYLLKQSIGEMKRSADLHGSTMSHINRGPFLGFPVGLPPLAEQRRIVAAIEQQFTRLDAAVAALHAARQKLKRLRAAVLKAACEGRLVPTEAELARAEGRSYETGAELVARILAERRARWEAEQQEKYARGGKQPPFNWRSKYEEPAAPNTSALPELPDGWCWAGVGQVAISMKNGIYKPQNAYSDAGIACLRMYNIHEGKLIWKDIRRLLLDPRELDDYRMQPGDLVVNRVNSRELVGKAAVFPTGLEPCVFEAMNIRLRLDSEAVVSQFVNFRLLQYGRDYFSLNVKQTVGMGSISQEQLACLPLPLPPIAEQQRIVAEVERRLSAVERLEGAVEAGLHRAERLRQAILKRAFAGRLVPQDPADEPAAALLERIRAARNGTMTTKAAAGRRGRRAAREGAQLGLPGAWPS